MMLHMKEGSELMRRGAEISRFESRSMAPSQRWLLESSEGLVWILHILDNRGSVDDATMVG